MSSELPCFPFRYHIRRYVIVTVVSCFAVAVLAVTTDERGFLRWLLLHRSERRRLWSQDSETQLLCNSEASPPNVTARSFVDSPAVPAEVLEACQTRKPTESSWVWPGRDWCWVATKRHACYGRHSWRDAQEQAAKDGQAPKVDLAELPALLQADLCDRPSHGSIQSQTGNASVQQDDAPRRGSPADGGSSAEQRAARASLQAEQEEADSWFRRNVEVYVLNLPTAVNRWLRISKRLHELGIEATQTAGIDLSSEGALQKAQDDGLVPFSWNLSLAERNMIQLFQNSSTSAAERYVNDYGRGTIGCAAAHLRAMWQAANQGMLDRKPLALILEDDVWPEDDFILKLHRLLREEAPCDWEVISLRSQCPYGICVSPHLMRVQPDTNEPEEMCRHGVNYGFYAMLYRIDSLATLANKLHKQIWDSSKPGCLANDVALASISDKVAYYAVPASQVPGFVSHDWSSSSVRSMLNRQGSLDRALERKRQANQAKTA
eukprot:TRINITY_DN9099_c0_g1_i1.p1 TRINITY_DN9099_c0_g1~~TRINITY_DN9099_c0_g1_i1.p1  ORF type:complete len:491 (-),score=84.54 TRINITY_DN9099_c0_g1_i1:199-1671(-)